MPKKKSVFSEEEKEEIVINQIIFHVIITEEAEPQYTEGIIGLDEEQKIFWKKHLITASEGRQYKFTEDSKLRPIVKEILKSDEKRFIALSKVIAKQFKDAHTNNTKNGVFLVVTAAIKDRVLLYLVKLDFPNAYSLIREKDNRIRLAKIESSVSQDPNDIQKSALIDLSEEVEWDALVIDKYAKSSKGYITDYFRDFLGVEKSETEEELTKEVINNVFTWAKENKEKFGLKPQKVKDDTISYLRSHDNFEDNDFVSTIVKATSPAKRKQQEQSLRTYFVDQGLAGQRFTPDESAITKSVEKHVSRTEEGVEISWTGEFNTKNIKISEKPDENGQYTITIKTTKINLIK